MDSVSDAITKAVAPAKLGLVVVVGEPVALEVSPFFVSVVGARLFACCESG